MKDKFDIPLAQRESVFEVEEGTKLAPKFDENGLIPVITTDSKSGEVLMHGYMNREALSLTIHNMEAYYWSRSRKSIWHKGKTSGLIQKVRSIRIDDDQDSIWLIVDVEGIGASCHVGYRSCFYRSINHDGKNRVVLKFEEDEKLFDPEVIYAGQGNPTKL